MLTLFLRINEEEKVEDSEELSHPVSISYNNGKANIFKKIPEEENKEVNKDSYGLWIGSKQEDVFEGF